VITQERFMWMKFVQLRFGRSRRPTRALRYFAVSAVVVALAAFPAAADFEAGYQAYQREDFTAALREWLPLAQQGDSDAQTSVGLLLFLGEGVPRDPTEAVRWFRLAAERDNTIAQYYLGSAHKTGEGAARDYPEAVKWYLASAKRGYADAQNDLGVMYEFGRGVPQDLILAYYWYNLAASQARDEDHKSIANRARVARGLTPEQLALAQQMTRGQHQAAPGGGAADVLPPSPRPQTPPSGQPDTTSGSAWVAWGKMPTGSYSAIDSFLSLHACQLHIEARLEGYRQQKGAKPGEEFVVTGRLVEVYDRTMRKRVSDFSLICLPGATNPNVGQTR
jgi:hypothetical protein